MTVKTDYINDIDPGYMSPEITVIEVKVQSVLCRSNGPMREYDYGNGGFGNDF